VLTNYSLPERPMAVVVPVSVAYGTDLEKAERVTAEVARSVLHKAKGGDEKFEPFIRYSSFDQSGISFSVILRVKEFTDRYLVTHEFVKALTKRYAKEGIEIPVPKRDVYLKKQK
jgi:small-conductance mechanosensitive channel